MGGLSCCEAVSRVYTVAQCDLVGIQVTTNAGLGDGVSATITFTDTAGALGVQAPLDSQQPPASKLIPPPGDI